MKFHPFATGWMRKCEAMRVEAKPFEFPAAATNVTYDRMPDYLAMNT